ncbi:related to ELG1 Protein required for S phase progression and telomere homeostasis, forms an alternative replication factor C complex important for DNA replication and genome integrity [Rhynchosporium secalis]|uniref:Related to ELG1 Protein required for S phase progression and telomere homeostasis, forms an alternative replication factor C complex important for DNA replication and genome integrity n=1 Tax=Rhynchosporium secalis TaxID=38038 RepID=A0A1E1LWL7_RHYSE|nr:related to ELG1 Protein required for S phase progression and telomere homeostasis, forms an alternative replication factor C complex important for DNA replication and genome integrity [Rhynchosporium secalis]
MSVLAEKGLGELNEEAKSKMFPLFQKGSKPKPVPPKEPAQEPPVRQPESTATKEASARAGKRTKATKTLDSEESGSTRPISNIEIHADLLEVDPNNARKKRRKTASPKGRIVSTNADAGNVDTVDGHPSLNIGDRSPKLQIDRTVMGVTLPNELDHGNSGAAVQERILLSSLHEDALGLGDTVTAGREYTSIYSTNNGVAAREKDSLDVNGCTQPDLSANINAVQPDVNQAPPKPTKVLRFNPRTGTIGSPPTKKTAAVIEDVKLKSKKGRGRPPKTLIVTIRYGERQNIVSSMGERIDLILNSPPSAPNELTAAPAKSRLAKSIQPKPLKPVHPLFLSKAAELKVQGPQISTGKDTGIADLTGNEEMVTQPRARSAYQLKGPSPKKPSAAFSGSGGSTKIVRFPGAIEPAWPWKGMVHIRGVVSLVRDEHPGTRSPPLISSIKKSKYKALQVSGTENIIESLATDLSIKTVVQSIQDINPDEYPSKPQCLRTPTKTYESGFGIQKKIRKLLRTRLPLPKGVIEESSEDDIQLDDIHPALLGVYTSIASSMSAFDRGQCETQSWSHKYSPKSTAQVLQKGQEAKILKKWLEALTVQSVEIGSGGKSATATKSNNAGKRKRKSKKLDGFVISTDEEDNDMDEITDPENEAPNSGPRQPKRTVIRGKDVAASGCNVANTVVLSGPHGCGKTAAVYAAAKELGFEVFEINAGSRRNGKDIMERVGDMTRNHQVQRSVVPVQNDGTDEDKERIDNALADDLKSGRQGKMDSFFKSQPIKSQPQPRLKETTKKPDIAKEVNAPKIQNSTASVPIDNAFSKMSKKKQQQSLILIEEADILYKEDNQFWITIVHLIATSKRPIIITCNDESILPMADLKLHATIRMVPPAVDLAVDYLLLVAACEGHIIKRKAVKQLYEGRNMDLRASLTELNFWCQFAVGDIKGGLEWYYPRWPAGNDVDEHGNVIRVVSEGTYEAGMGWLSQDFLESHVHHLDIEEETLHEACDGWGFDLGDWVENIGVKKWAGKARGSVKGMQDDFAVLSMYADFAESMSATDLCSGGTFAPEHKIALDVSLPELTMKSRDDYTIASELKEAPALVNYNTTGNDISLYMKSRSRKILHLDQHIQHNLEVPTELDRPSESTILRLISDKIVSPKEGIDRFDLSLAFDPISSIEKYVWSTSLEASSFDRTMTLIVEDLAPYVRSIVAYDARLQQDRLRLSNLLSEGGRKGKRMRTTRAAMSALEGGVRTSTRRDKYFTAALNTSWVLRTGMKSWLDAARVEEEIKPAILSRRSSKASLDGDSGGENERDELESSP